MKIYYHLLQNTHTCYSATKLHFRHHMSISKSHFQFKNCYHSDDAIYYKNKDTTNYTPNFFGKYLAIITGMITLSLIGKFFLQEDNCDSTDNNYNKDRLIEQAEIKAERIKFATWNIDTSLNIEANYAEAFEPWRIKNRIPNIIKFIEKVNPDILHLQEVRKKDYDGELINSVDPIKDFLETKGYEVLLCLYDPLQADFFQYITAYKAEKFKIFGTTAQPIETTNRCIFITKLQHIQTGQNLYTFNIHMDPEKNKIEGSHMINQLVKQYITEQPTLGIIIAGDFNSFSDTNGNEQMQILTDSKVLDKPLLEVTNDLLLPDKSPIPESKTTFFYYPYDLKYKDFFKNLEASQLKEAVKKIFASDKCKARGGHLDHILVYNLTADENSILEVSPQFDPFPLDYTETTIKNYIISNIDNGPAFLSDHQLIWVDLLLSGEPSNYSVI